MEIISGKLNKPERVVVYGPEGIGKSCFAERFPKPYFFDTEGSTDEMDVKRAPKAITWGHLQEQLIEIQHNHMGFETAVIDTADWAEKLAKDEVCAEKGIEALGAMAKDFGVSYNLLETKWGKFLNQLTNIHESGMQIVLLAHAHLRKFEQPEENGAYDRWTLKLTQTPKIDLSAMCKEWATMVLFVNFKTYVVEIDDKKKASSGGRVMYAMHNACWDAKNRHGLDKEIPFQIDKNGIHQGYEAIRPCIEKTHSKPALQQAVDTPPLSQPTSEEYQKTMEQPPVKPTATGTRVPMTNPKSFPAKLWNLMTLNGVEEIDIQQVCAKKGYYPESTPISLYDQKFVDGVLVAAWDKVYEAIKQMKGAA